MKDTTHWKVPKWPFLLGDALLLTFASLLVWRAPHPISQDQALACLAAAALGAGLGALPFILDYRAILKVIETNALGAVADRIQNLERLAAQIQAATHQWDLAQGQAERTAAGAREIAERMAAEVREFTAFMQKMNDTEKAALRLEAEKLRRGEGEWLQVLLHILDHVFALHAAAARSGQPRLIEQITHFQKACHDTVRRLGVIPFIAAADEPFDPQRHQAEGNHADPPGSAVVAETLATGYTYQGRPLRPALVRLREESANPIPPAASSRLPDQVGGVPPPQPEDPPDSLSLSSTD